MVYFSKFISLMLLLTLMNACAPIIHTDFDRDFNFSQLKNYELLTENHPNTGLDILDGPLVSKRIIQSLNVTLQAHGYINSSSSDFYVVYQLETKTERSRALEPGYDFGYFGGYYGHGIYSSNFYNEYKKAVLVIKLYRDRNKSVLLWQGLSEKKLQTRSTDAAYIDKLIHQMVTSILKKFPPK